MNLLGPTIKVKLLHPHAKAPLRMEAGSVGLDLFAVESTYIWASSPTKIPLGFALEIPHGFYGAIMGRSGLAAKGIVAHTGTIDASYRGEVCALLYAVGLHSLHVHRGDRIGQLLILPDLRPRIEVVAELSNTERGDAGFGSTGVA